MSRVVTIKSLTKIENMNLAEQSLSELGISGVHVQEGLFVFNGYQYDDGFEKELQMKELEHHYFRLLQDFKKKEVIKNAKKQGYTVKQELMKDNTVKLVLQKRIY